MNTNTIPPFSAATIEGVCREIAELYNGNQISQILGESGLSSQDPGTGITKWTRLTVSVSAQQANPKQNDGRPLIRLLLESMKPPSLLAARANGQPISDSEIDEARRRINTYLTPNGYHVCEDGKVSRSSKTATTSEARRRHDSLKSHLEQAGAHPDVIKHCRIELLRDDYYEAIFEGIKGLGDRVRRLSGIDKDGRNLAQEALGGRHPKVTINDLSTTTKRNEQVGTSLLMEGIFAAFRNPAAHEPRTNWGTTQEDAEAILGILSFIHRRLDDI